MDAQRIKSRVQGFLSAFSPQQIVLLGVMGVVAIVSLLWFVSWLTKPSYTTLSAGLTAEQTKEITSKLDDEAVGYKLADGGSTVQVKSSDVSKARLAVGGANGTTGSVVGFEVFDKTSFTQSDLQQQVALQRALQGELTRSIMKMDGVTSATVHLAIPTQRLFQKDQQPTQAAIMVQSSGTLTESQVDSIVKLVSGSVPGLDQKNVTVTDTKGRVLTQGGASSASGDRQLAQTQAYELALAARAESMLAEVYGPGHVVVRVTADMNYNQGEVVTTNYTGDPKAVKQSSTSETFTGAGSPPGGVVGVEGSVTDTGSTTSNNNYERTENGVENVVSSEITRAITAPGSVKRLSVAAIVDSSLPDGPQVTDVENLVKAAVGFDQARNDTVAVQQVKFDEEQQQALDAAREAAQAALNAGGPSQMMNYVRTGVGVLMLLMVALFLRKGLRTQVETIDLESSGVLALEAPTDAATADGNTIALVDGAVDVREPAAVTAGRAELPMELRLIDQDPEQVATLLRSWIADRRK